MLPRIIDVIAAFPFPGISVPNAKQIYSSGESRKLVSSLIIDKQTTYFKLIAEVDNETRLLGHSSCTYMITYLCCVLPT